MSKIKGQKKAVNSNNPAGETTPGSARAAALARLGGLFGEITECLSWADLDRTAKADARSLALECLVHAQGSWATADTLFGLGEALLKHAPELIGVGIFTRDEGSNGDVIHGATARRAAQLAALGADCITLALSLGTPARTLGPRGWVCLDAELHWSTADEIAKGGAR